MKVYISADIEGTTSTTHWDETRKTHADARDAQEQMTAEVAAACEGALNAGATEVWVKDAHGSGRNIIPAKLPEEVVLVRGWSGHPFSMVQELDESFDAAMMIGYHSRAGSGDNPMAHTMSGDVARIAVNGECWSEFRLHACVAARAGVPVVLVSGDAGLCAEVETVNPAIATVAAKRGVGDSTLSLHPQRVVSCIREKAEKACRGNLDSCRLELPHSYRVEIDYKKHTTAYRASFFPGAKRMDSHGISFETDDYFEVLRLFLFTV